jgi:hypothetical protein
MIIVTIKVNSNKSRASSEKVETESYFADFYHQGYKIQMDFYNCLLQGMGFKTSTASYFLVVNASKIVHEFNGNQFLSDSN